MIIHNKRPLWAANQPLKPEDARAGTTMSQIQGDLCRLQLTLDMHFTPGDPRVEALCKAALAILPALAVGVGMDVDVGADEIVCLEPLEE